MKKAFFISDAHIGAESPQRERSKAEKLNKFFDIVKSDGKILFILGDFFDFWFDYKKIIFSEHFPVLKELADVSGAGIEIHIFGGNHDWWMQQNGFLGREIGATIHRKPTTMNILDKKFFLAHGDGIAPSDWGYRNLLCPILRNPVSVFLFGLLPAEWGFSLAKLVSSSSKLYTEKRNLRFEREYEDFARKMIEERGIDYVIMGHLHLPLEKNFNKGKYVNIGDFYKNFTYATFDGKDIKIERM